MPFRQNLIMSLVRTRPCLYQVGIFFLKKGPQSLQVLKSIQIIQTMLGFSDRCRILS